MLSRSHRILPRLSVSQLNSINVPPKVRKVLSMNLAQNLLKDFIKMLFIFFLSLY